MKVVSVNVGMPRDAMWKGLPVWTSIFKESMNGPVMINKLNLTGDSQADLSVHCGPDKAVYGYPSKHYEYWREQVAGAKLSCGAFGENLTTEGLSESTLCIGDRLKIGSAVLVVTQPRMPCYKLNLRFGRDDMIERFLVSERTGFYLSVLQTGDVSAGSKIEILQRDPNRVSVTDVVRLYLGYTRDIELLRRAVTVTSLPHNWRTQLLARADVGNAP